MNETFERKSIASQLLLRKKLLLTKYNPNRKTMANHLLMFDKLIRELRATGAKLEETDLVCHLLLTMPTEFNHVVTAIETLSAENLTIGFVKNRLLDEEAKLQDHGKKKQASVEPLNAAFIGHSNKLNTIGHTSKGGGNKFKFQCYKCGGYGHKQADCKKKDNTHNQTKTANVALTTQKEEDSTEFCFSAHIGEGQILDWALDSGATEHLGNENTSLKNIKPLRYPLKIRIAKSGVTLQAVRYGEAVIYSSERKEKLYHH